MITPSGQELIERTGLHDRTGQGMGTETRRLLEDTDAQVGLELFQANGAREARDRAAELVEQGKQKAAEYVQTGKEFVEQGAEVYAKA